MNRNFSDYCYDRYHHAQTEEAYAPTRYLMCDYALTAVTYRRKFGLGVLADSSVGCNTFAATLEMHMQRHYYQLFLMNVIDKSVMLHLSSRISKAVEVYDGQYADRATAPTAEDHLAAEMQAIERDFLHYVHRFRFTGVSSQLQPSEMHAQMRKLMKLDSIYADIKDELQTAVEFLSTREAKRAADAAERLNIIATIGLILALVMGFLSMNVITEKDVLMHGLVQTGLNSGDVSTAAWHRGWRWFGGVLTTFCISALLISMVMTRFFTGRTRETSTAGQATLWMLLGGAVLGLILPSLAEFLTPILS